MDNAFERQIDMALKNEYVTPAMLLGIWGIFDREDWYLSLPDDEFESWVNFPKILDEVIYG